MTKDTTPKAPTQSAATEQEYGQYVMKARLLEERLQSLSYLIHGRSVDVVVEFEGRKPFERVEAMADTYVKLSRFTDLLAESIQLNAAEVTEDTVTFGKSSEPSRELRKYFKQGMDKRLLYELREMAGNYFDGDPSNVIKQVEQYMDKLRERYDLPGQENDKPRTR